MPALLARKTSRKRENDAPVLRWERHYTVGWRARARGFKLEAVILKSGVLAGTPEYVGLRAGWGDADSAARVGRLRGSSVGASIARIGTVEDFLRHEESLQAAPPDDVLY